MHVPTCCSAWGRVPIAASSLSSRFSSCRRWPSGRAVLLIACLLPRALGSADRKHREPPPQAPQWLWREVAIQVRSRPSDIVLVNALRPKPLQSKTKGLTDAGFGASRPGLLPELRSRLSAGTPKERPRLSSRLLPDLAQKVLDGKPGGR